MVYIGVDIGGTGIQVGVVSPEGVILHKGAIVTRIDIPVADQIAAMAQCVLDTLRTADLTLDDVKAVGLGVPGIVDPRTGHIPFCTNLGWHDVDLVGEFRKHIDKPIFVGNDATVAALAESVAGASAGTSSSVLLTLGTGVGGGIIINGKVWNGFHGVGSEIGHMILQSGGEQCNCGNRGCLERYASATAVILMARRAVAEHPDSMIMTTVDGDPAKINAKVVFDAAKAGDAVALDIFNRYVEYLAQGLGNIVNFFDPEVIVLGGGLSKSGNFLLDALRAAFPKYCLYKTMPTPEILLAKLGPDAGIIGAAMLGQ